MHPKTCRRALALLVPTLGMLAAAAVTAAPAQAVPTCSVTYVVVNAWPAPGGSGKGGFRGEFTLTNNGTTTTTGWRVEVHFQAGVEVTQNYNSTLLLDADPTYVFGNAGHNGPIRPGGTELFGVIASKTAAASSTPLNFVCSPLF